MPQPSITRAPGGRAIGIAIAIGVLVGSGGGILLEVSVASAIVMLTAGAVISFLVKALRRWGDVSEPLARNAETIGHAPVVVPTRKPRP